jgi:hypothetical protein
MSFTMFDKFGDSLASLPEGVRAEMFAALCEYGFYGTEPEFDGDLAPFMNALFTAFREDVDNSKQMRTRGERGGRPSAKKHQVAQVIDEPKPQVSANAKPEVSDDSKPEVSETAKPEVIDGEKPQVSANAKPKPNQTKLNQTKPKGERGARKPARRPPTPEEVEEYVEANGLSVDATRFCDYFSAQGWRLANGNPMRDWHAAARNWSRREAQKPEGVSAGEWDQF